MSYATHGLGQTAEADLTMWRRDLALARDAGIPVPVLKALQATESGGNPAAIRFEPHVFWRERKRMPRGSTGPQIRAALTPSELASVPFTPCTLSWRTANDLPPCRHDRAASEVSSETNRTAFNRAFAIDPVNAVKATSWGSGQVLGQHLLNAFGGDPRRAVDGFYANPVEAGERMIVSWWQGARRDAIDAANASPPNFDMVAARYNGCTDCTTYANRLRTHYTRILPEWTRVRAAVEAAGALAVSAATHNPMITVVLGATVLGAGGAFAWWAYRKRMARNRRRTRRARSSSHRF